MITDHTLDNRSNAYDGLNSRIEQYRENASFLYSKGLLKPHITYHTKGINAGLKSLNVFPIEECWIRYLSSYDNRLICSHCSSCRSLLTHKQRMIEHLIGNSELFSHNPSENVIEGLYGPIMINVIGEIINVNHCRHIVSIARSNADAVFSVVTTKGSLFDQHIRSLPSNLIVIDLGWYIAMPKPKANRSKCSTKTFTYTDRLDEIDPSLIHVCDHKCMICYSKRIGCFGKDNKDIYCPIKI